MLIGKGKMKMIKKGDKLDLSGVFDDVGITLKRTDDKDVGEYQYSIPLSFSDDSASIAGAVDVSSSGEILGVELVMIQQAIANPKPSNHE